MWWSGNANGVGGTGILVKEELCDKVVEVQRKSSSDDNGDCLREGNNPGDMWICATIRKPDNDKDRFHDELASEWELGGTDEMILGFGDFNGHVGKQINGFEGIHGGNGIGERNLDGRRLLEFCDKKELCVTNTWFRIEERQKVT